MVSMHVIYLRLQLENPESAISITSNIKADGNVQQGDNLIKVQSQLDQDGAISPHEYITRCNFSDKINNAGLVQFKQYNSIILILKFSSFLLKIKIRFNRIFSK